MPYYNKKEYPKQIWVSQIPEREVSLLRENLAGIKQTTFVLIKKEEKENKTASGIVLSTEKKEVPSIANVIAVGDECTSSLKENDRVIYKEYSGTKVTVEDQDYIVIDEKDIIAKFE